MCGRKGWTTQGAAIHASFGLVGGWGEFGNEAAQRGEGVQTLVPVEGLLGFEVECPTTM